LHILLHSLLKKPENMKLIVARILISAVVILFLGWLLPGVEVVSSWKAVIAALVLALINAFIRPVLIFLTLPATIVTLGLFLFVINALMVLLAARWVDGFKVDGFWWALLFSFLLSILNSWLQEWLLAGHEDKQQPFP
jgi:putative membrane protein